MGKTFRKSNSYLPYIIVFSAWIISLATKLHTHGLLYGFDFGLYHPDGTLYSFRTLTWLGKSQAEAGQEISKWYANHASKFVNVDPNTLFFDVNPGWEIYNLRYLYPLLSIPFVFFFGLSGMLVVPALSMLVLMLAVYEISKDYDKRSLGLLIAVFFSFSLTISRWMYVNTADSLLVAFFSVVVIVLSRRPEIQNFGVIICALIFLTSFTRFAFLIWLAIGLVFIIQKSNRLGLMIMISSILAFLPTLFVNFAPSILANESSLPLGTKILQFPQSCLRVAFYEISQLVVLDKYLMAFLVLATLISLVNVKAKSSLFYLAALVSLWLTGAINGVVGVNFRYQLPLLIFAAWVILESYDSFSKRTRLYLSPKFR
jgi:hypothetical protein